MLNTTKATAIENVINTFGVTSPEAITIVNFINRHENNIKKIYEYAEDMYLAGSLNDIVLEKEWQDMFEEAAGLLEKAFIYETGIIADKAHDAFKIILFENSDFDTIFQNL